MRLPCVSDPLAKAWSIAANENGITAIVWRMKTGGGDSDMVYSSVLNNGQWSSAYMLGPACDDSTPDVDVSSEGVVTVVWRSSGGVVLASIYKGVSWGQPTNVGGSISDVCRYGDPQVISDRKGKTFILISGNEILVNVLSGGKWSGPSTISKPGRGVGHPSIVSDSKGTATVAWGTYNRTTELWDGISTARLVNGNWSEFQDITEDSSQGPVNLSLDGQNNPILLWYVKPQDASVSGPSKTIKTMVYKNSEWLPYHDIDVGVDAKILNIKPGLTVAYWMKYHTFKNPSILTVNLLENGWTASVEHPLPPDDYTGVQKIIAGKNFSNEAMIAVNGRSKEAWSILSYIIGGDPNPKSDILYSIQVSIKGSGSVTSTPSGIECGDTCVAQFKSGEQVYLSASGKNGKSFNGWGGDCVGQGFCNLNMDGNKNVSASFGSEDPAPNGQLIKVIRPSNGAVSSEPSGILCGGPNKQCSSSFSSTKLTATPNFGYEFIRWNGCQAPEGNTCHLKPIGKITVSAVFKKLPRYTIKISKNTLGSITSNPAGLVCPDKKKSCSVKFVKGAQVTLTPTPQSNRSFGGWTGACSGLDACTLLVDGNKGVGAIFQ